MIADSDVRPLILKRYKAYGHSLLVSPWGRVIEQLDEKPGFVIQELDEKEFGIRQQIPILAQKRTDLYAVTDKKQ